MAKIGFEKDVPGSSMMPGNASPGGIGGRTRASETVNMPDAHLGMNKMYQGYPRRMDAVHEE